jgi:hypothetical protein
MERQIIGPILLGAPAKNALISGCLASAIMVSILAHVALDQAELVGCCHAFHVSLRRVTKDSTFLLLFLHFANNEGVMILLVGIWSFWRQGCGRRSLGMLGDGHRVVAARSNAASFFPVI